MRRGELSAVAWSATLLLLVLASLCMLAPPRRVEELGLSEQGPLTLPLNTLAMIPLKYYSGVFELELSVGASPVHAVFDTGSEKLIVAGQACVKQAECSAGAGHYTGDGAKALGRSSTITYGTQTDTVQWYVDELRFRTRVPTKLLETDECRIDGLVDAPERELHVLAMEFGVVESRHGHSSLNVFGFCRGTNADCTSRALLGERAVFAVLFYDKTGWLALGAPTPLGHCAKVKYVPLIRPIPSMRGYFIVRVAGVAVVSADGRETRACHRAPKYAIIDTGSNMLSVSTPLLEELRHRGISTFSSQRLQIRLEGATLDYDRSEYSMGGELLVRDNLPFHNVRKDDVLLLGTLFMRRRYLEFDLERERLGIVKLRGTSKLPPATPAPQPRVGGGDVP